MDVNWRDFMIPFVLSVAKRSFAKSKHARGNGFVLRLRGFAPTLRTNGVASTGTRP
jgi:hypothetical protein